MDASQRRCFLEVYTDVDEEPRLLQLEPNVKLRNVLERFDEDGDLYWREQLLDPEATPASLGLPCGVDEANTLRFVPASASYVPPSATWTSQRTPLVESTAAMQSSPPSLPQETRTPSLPAYVGASADAPPAAVSWYSRPRLLSPAQPPAASVLVGRGRASSQNVATAAPYDARFAAVPAAYRLSAGTRRNRPILMDPALLVDDAGPVETLRSELRRLQRDVDSLKRRERLVESPIPASSSDASVEELATELHDRQMHRLYEQRRLYLTHGQTAS